MTLPDAALDDRLAIRKHSDAVAEEEANYFALLMLMPRGCFEEAMKEPLDLFDEAGLKKVAKLFQVSVPMVLARARL